MRYLALVFVVMFPTAAMAALDGDWVCTYSEPPNWTTTYKLQFIAGRLIVQKHDGAKYLIKDAVLTDRYAFWEDPDQNEFYPAEGRLVHGQNKGQRTYSCTKNP